tara:strand:+ start:36590 stop:37150 length:561 start_codon:yes stop_codon:yes gene_type:complete
MNKFLSSGLILAVGFTSISLLAVAQPIRKPALTVVYDSGKSVDAAHYYGKRLRSSGTPKNTRTVPPAPARPLRSVDLADNLPLVSQRLRPGQLNVREFEGVVSPFFVMGMDPQSITWLEDAADVLAEMNAVGFVVQADNRSDWLDLKTFAEERGIRVSLLHGDGLADVYGLTTYPSVITGKGSKHE